MESTRKSEILREIGCAKISLSPELKKRRYNKCYFTYDSYKDVLGYNQLLLNLKSFENDRIFIILSSENEAYKIFMGEDKYKEKLGHLLNQLKNNSVFQMGRTNYYQLYALMEVSRFISLEQQLNELCLLFRFSSFIICDKKTEFIDAMEVCERFSFFKTYGYPRWRKIAKAYLFFDGEHWCGSVCYR
jgi:hypothetical protein